MALRGWVGRAGAVGAGLAARGVCRGALALAAAQHRGRAAEEVVVVVQGRGHQRRIIQFYSQEHVTDKRKV